jgi:hypothetical protein
MQSFALFLSLSKSCSLVSPRFSSGSDQLRSIRAARKLAGYLGLLVATLFTLTLPVAAQNVTTQQYGNARTGVQSHESALTPANVNPNTFGKLFSLPVIGHVYAEPLYVAGLTMADGTVHNVLFVATERDYVYAFDADGNNPTQGFLWRVALLGTGETWVPDTDVGSSDIKPDIGITSTPVIDLATNTLYAVAVSKTTSGTVQYFSRLHALNITDGREKLNGPTTIQGTVPGTGDGGTTISFNPFLGNQRPGLLLAPTPRGTSAASVFITWASHGDNGRYHGWVISYDAADISQQTGIWCNTPNGVAGGIWMPGSGLSSDDNGSIFGASGNGTFDANTGGRDYGESVFALAINAQTLAPTSTFTPAEQNNLNIYDNDMGTGGVMLLPTQSGANPHLALTVNKLGKVFLMDRDNLGGYTTPGEASLQSFSLGYTYRDSLAFFNNKLYEAGEGGPLTAFTFNPQTELFSTTAAMRSSVLFGCSDCASGGTTPAISANGTSNGIVWALDVSGRENTPAILRAFDASNITTELYDSTQAANGRDAGPIAIAFTSAVVANGNVYVGGVNAVTAYGELDRTERVTISAAPTSIGAGAASTLSVVASNARQVTVTGSDGSSYTLGVQGGTQVVTPAATTTYTATANGSAGKVTAATTVTVTSQTGGCVPSSAGSIICQPVSGSTVVSPVTIAAGSIAASGYISAIRAYIDSVAVLTVNNPTTSTSFQINQAVTVAAGAHHLVIVSYESTGGALSASEDFTVGSNLPTVAISASPSSITAGASSTLNVSATNATQVTVAGSDGSSFSLASSGGSHTVTPSVTTTYTATATGNGGKATSSATVTVASQPGGCLPSASGAIICQPGSGATVASPVTFAAGAVAQSGFITAIRVYVDSIPVLTVNNPAQSTSFQINQAATVSAGTHHLVIVAYESTGGALTASESFTVSGGGSASCIAPSADVMICSPAQGATVSSPIQLSAGATAGSGFITAIRVYVDNVAQTLVNNPQMSTSFSINQPLPIAAGVHSLAVVGYQSTGGAVSDTETITVQ